ncbi:Nucleic acid-binding, OB-fold-like protein [Prunus dulcis]|uniref:Nucleic acid-binding, OB-fold-like protein n=1 Tax=Prunus dulcis TaxID=3755 RepID=A0A4Y1R703_PRUDU|nr:Nucleic acid-binding, OB-fold-like protein [Prunus dulcis]
MPKNKGKGGKNRKRGKNEADDEKRELVFKEDGQEYAQVLRMLVTVAVKAMCIDGTKRLCHIRGKMHKKVWIAAGDIILVGLRDYQDDKADVILKYMPDEARLLKAYGELPENTRLNEGIAGVLKTRKKAVLMTILSLRMKILIRYRGSRIKSIWMLYFTFTCSRLIGTNISQTWIGSWLFMWFCISRWGIGHVPCNICYY